MPSKSHRAASRQAKLRQKRRRVKAADQVFEAGPTGPRAVVEETDTDDQVGPETRQVAVASASSPLQPVRRSRQSQSGAAAARYAYLGSEIRRIGIISILIFAILAAVSFLLSG